MKDLGPEYSDAIAITGLAGRFPGAASVADFGMPCWKVGT